MLTIRITGDDAVARRFDAMPTAVRKALIAKMQALALRLENKVKSEKLSGQVLHARSGDLRRSIMSVVEDQDSQITARLYSTGVKYAGIHEFGGKTAAHEIVAKKAKALAFMMGGKMVFFKRVHHPGSVMPMRSYMRSALEEMRGTIIAEMEQALREAIRT